MPDTRRRRRPQLTLVGRPAEAGEPEAERPHDGAASGSTRPPAHEFTTPRNTGSVDTGAAIDTGRVTIAATALLTALNIDDLLGTKAAQMGQALTRMVTRRPLVIQVSPNRADYEELIVSKSIGFRALCEEHMLPLSGLVHIGYIPHQFLMSATEPARVVGYFARQPQSPQQLASQVAHWLDRQLQPLGVGVVVHADHSCNGDLATFEPSVTVSSTLLGQVRDVPSVRAHFLSLTSSR